MSYHQARKAKQAEQYLRERDIEKAAAAAQEPDGRKNLDYWRAWVANYKRPPSSFDWRPRYVMTPPGSDNAEEIIEGEFTECAEQGDESRVEKAEGGEGSG